MLHSHTHTAKVGIKGLIYRPLHPIRTDLANTANFVLLTATIQYTHHSPLGRPANNLTLKTKIKDNDSTNGNM